jgi:hypothetical protein
LRILFTFGGVIEGELDVVKGPQFGVSEESHAVAVGSYRELDG